MSVRKIDPITGAISFELTKEEEQEHNKIKLIKSLVERVEILEKRVRELEKKYES